MGRKEQTSQNNIEFLDLASGMESKEHFYWTISD